MFQKRRENLLSLMKEREMDAVVFVPGSNLYYFTGLKLKQSERLTLAILARDGKLTFLAPQVELSKVETVANKSTFWYTDEEGPANAISQLKEHAGSLGIVGVEFGYMRVMEQKAAEAIGYENLVDLSHCINELRMQKEANEIELMKKAVQIVEESLEATLDYIKPGAVEIEIAAQLEYEMRRRGSEGTPFGTIVASGYRGALPHGRAADKKIESGDLIVLDFGSIYKGYVADITRTVAVGEISDELKKVYEIVKKANETAIEAVKPGVTAHDIDETARSIIREAGFGQYFTHRLGHGLGLSAHEDPYMMQQNNLVLKSGMAFTIEPGIYLKDKGGVRIEDNIIVTEEGHLNLMSYTKDLIVL
ncbi:M24 family metallopeptidase [Pseudalkalibacillus decolorationis]|uniref:M24 family metallopeptidase n=1 Tax=Pseudalkalibacillus decolorationis TaxID=163879 RepID=UPI002147C69B|nr:aminopeptidase P family protein [Pseudalkalibacillus decolorationis]